MTDDRRAVLRRLVELRNERGWTSEQVRLLARTQCDADDARTLTTDQARDLCALIICWSDLWNRCITYHIKARVIIAFLLNVDPSVGSPEGDDLDRTKMTPRLYDLAFAWMDGVVASYDDERLVQARERFQAEAIGGDDGRDAAARWLSERARPREAWLEAARIHDHTRRHRLFDMLRARHGDAVERPLADAEGVQGRMETLP